MFVDLQVCEETVVGLQTEHVDGVAAFDKELVVKLLDESDRVLEERLRVQGVRVEVERQHTLEQARVNPKRSLLLQDHLQDVDQDLRLALVVQERAVAFVVCNYYVRKLFLHLPLTRYYLKLFYCFLLFDYTQVEPYA